MPTNDERPAGPATVYLIGAGPGDPGLLTVRGRDCLRRADVVVYDYLVNPALLAHAPAGAEILDAGKRKGEQRDRKSTRLNSSHIQKSRMPSSA